jgi:hypothetical protein
MYTAYLARYLHDFLIVVGPKRLLIHNYQVRLQVFHKEIGLRIYWQYCAPDLINYLLFEFSYFYGVFIWSFAQRLS